MQSVRKKISENIHTESVQEYLNLDKITMVKMLLASKEENKKLHDKLDKLREEVQEREAKAEEREAKAEARNEELMRANRRQMEYQVKLMDQLAEMQHQLNKTSDQYADLLVELKRQKNLNKQAARASTIINKFVTARTYHQRWGCRNFLKWCGLMEYRENREYSIGNNIVERNVRPFTVVRKNTMTFGSEEGIDYAATYHTIIQTCRMMGVKVLKYLQSFFKKFSEG